MSKQAPSRFSLLDARIKRNLIEAGEALAEIRDDKLFVEGGFKSFRDYCEAIGKSYQWAWLQIKAAEVAKELPVKNEAQAREVRKIAIPQRKQVVQEAIKQSKGNLTAPVIKNAVQKAPERKSKPSIAPDRQKFYDETGMEIPPEILEFWNRNEEVQHLLAMLSKVRVTLEKATGYEGDVCPHCGKLEKGKWIINLNGCNQCFLTGKINVVIADKLFKKVDLQGCIANLQRVKEEVECGKSYAVCPQCSGIMLADCSQCQGRGSLSKFHWSMVADEIKQLRENKN